jgi:hypothetical protein
MAPRNAYKVEGVVIRSVEGEAYPGDDSEGVTTTVIDCCFACFGTHVLPALEALGFKPRKYQGF